MTGAEHKVRNLAASTVAGVELEQKAFQQSKLLLADTNDRAKSLGVAVALQLEETSVAYFAIYCKDAALTAYISSCLPLQKKKVNPNGKVNSALRL